MANLLNTCTVASLGDSESCTRVVSLSTWFIRLISAGSLECLDLLEYYFASLNKAMKYFSGLLSYTFIFTGLTAVLTVDTRHMKLRLSFFLASYVLSVVDMQIFRSSDPHTSTAEFLAFQGSVDRLLHLFLFLLNKVPLPLLLLLSSALGF